MSLDSPPRRLALLWAASAALAAGCATPAPPPRPAPWPAPPPVPAPRPVPAPEAPPGAITSPVPSTGVPPGAPVPPPPPPAGRAPSLADEHARLRNELAGTPVVVELAPAGTLRVEVPQRFCFDAGKAVVKPPLAAVLDRMATGLRRQTLTQLRISAPADADGGAQLANERAASVRDYLVGKGVAPARFSATGRGDRPGVEVVVAEPGA